MEAALQEYAKKKGALSQHLREHGRQNQENHEFQKILLLPKLITVTVVRFERMFFPFSC